MHGSLFIVATPIGNLGDMTFRAVEVLKRVSHVACEDTRRTGKLLEHFGIRKTLIRYDEHVHKRVAPRLLEMLKGGVAIALVTDAGTPAISDPGSRLVEEAVRGGIPVVPIPGASAPVAALSASGWGRKGFIFIGFLPRKGGKAKRLLREMLGLGKTIVLLESPFRVQKTLAGIEEVEPNARVIVAREMTKVYEEFVRGDIGDVQNQLKGRVVKGEIVILVEPSCVDDATEETE